MCAAGYGGVMSFPGGFLPSASMNIRQLTCHNITSFLLLAQLAATLLDGTEQALTDLIACLPVHSFDVVALALVHLLGLADSGPVLVEWAVEWRSFPSGCLWSHSLVLVVRLRRLQESITLNSLGVKTEHVLG